MMQFSFVGSQQTVKEGLQQFLDDTDLDEIMVASHIFDSEAKKHSLELVADLFHTSVNKNSASLNPVDLSR